jgi:hypothetical protein
MKILHTSHERKEQASTLSRSVQQSMCTPHLPQCLRWARDINIELANMRFYSQVSSNYYTCSGVKVGDKEVSVSLWRYEMRLRAISSSHSMRVAVMKNGEYVVKKTISRHRLR